MGLPHPSPAGECIPPPPFGWGGGAFSLASERGGGVPIPTRGHTLWYSLYIRTFTTWCLIYTEKKEEARGQKGGQTAVLADGRGEVGAPPEKTAKKLWAS